MMLNKKNRYLLLLVGIVAAITVPVEMITFDLLAHGSRLSVADAWVGRMSTPERQRTAERISALPVEYRRALLRAMAPADRARVWNDTASGYLASHPDLTLIQRVAVESLRRLATVETFANPAASVDARRAAGEMVFNQLGKQALIELTRDAGPAAAQGPSPLPIRVRLESYIHGRLAASAQGVNCNCYTEQPTDCWPGFGFCSELTGCDFWYVGCGIWYLEPCNGYCIQG